MEIINQSFFKIINDLDKVNMAENFRVIKLVK